MKVTVAKLMKFSLVKTEDEVADYARASCVVQENRDSLCLGSGEWYGLGLGVITVDGRKVANVSYNGRVWTDNKLVMEASTGDV